MVIISIIDGRRTWFVPPRYWKIEFENDNKRNKLCTATNYDRIEAQSKHNIKGKRLSTLMQRLFWCYKVASTHILLTITLIWFVQLLFSRSTPSAPVRVHVITTFEYFFSLSITFFVFFLSTVKYFQWWNFLAFSWPFWSLLFTVASKENSLVSIESINLNISKCYFLDFSASWLDVDINWNSIFVSEFHLQFFPPQIYTLGKATSVNVPQEWITMVEPCTKQLQSQIQEELVAAMTYFAMVSASNGFKIFHFRFDVGNNFFDSDTKYCCSNSNNLSRLVLTGVAVRIAPNA